MTTLPNLATLRLKSLLIRKKKGETEENPIENLLKPIKSLEYEEDTDSDISEISDVFEEFHKNSYLNRQGKHHLTKHEADVKTMEDFTDDFKGTMSKIRHELQIVNNLFDESVDEIEKIFNNPTTPQVFPKVSVNEDITEMFNESTSSIPKREELEERKVSDTSSTSMIWHMLATNWNATKFEISPPGFNTFKQKHPHWLQRASVSWVDIDQATLKCEKWLEKCQI